MSSTSSLIVRASASVLAAGLAMCAVTPADATPAHDTIQATGSSWAANAVNQWVADVKSAGLRVSFTSTGSAQGRKDFAASINDFAISDIGYQGSDPKTGEADSSGRPYAYLPIVGGGTSFPYKILRGGKPITNLRLSGLTLAKIFTGAITNWNDPAITRDNNGSKIPSKPIIPVVHSEGAGSTAQFTRYLATMFPDLWTAFNNNPKFTEYYPRKGSMIAQSGSDGVMNYINSASGDGTIGYDEYSYPLGLGFPVAKIENAAGYYVLPDQFNDAVALTQAKINMDKSSPDYLLQDLDKVYTYNDPRAYPLSSYSYAVIPTSASDPRMTTPKRQTMADFLFYSVCGGQAEMGPIGYSSLPLNLVTASFDQVKKLKAADAGVDLSTQNPSNCNNPTFDKANPSRNRLAEIAKMPPSCDKDGQGPCGVGVPIASGGGTNGSGAAGGGTGSTGKGTSTGGAGTGGGTAAGGTGRSNGAGPAGAGASNGVAARTKIDPQTGQTISANGDAGLGADAVASPTDLAAFSRSGNNAPFAVLAVALLLLALVSPPLLARALARRNGTR
ncbi:MAG: phosphate transport system substrate-binding protein [Pseudonocardiales bacterium]|jgi:ABC-type phosphate transport system substrate-binding protein|nr:phosphate transport system substrate-binding protein [Pseudonocardiales bacterium]